MGHLIRRHSPTVLLSLGVLLAACGSDKRPGGANNNNNNTPPPATQATLQSLVVSVDIASPAVGDIVTATVKGRYSDGTDKDVVDGVTFVSSDPTVLEVTAEAPNKFLALKEGSAQILASVGTISANSTLAIGPVKLASLEIIPASKDIGMGATLKVEVIATYTDGTLQQVTKDVAWTSSNVGVLLPSATDKGYLVTFGQGSASITATLDGKSVTGEYTVGPAKMDYMIVTPSNTRIDMGNPVQYSATGYWSDRSFADVTSQVTWLSSNPAVATISPTGLATAVGDGETVITATKDDVSAMTVARTVTSACPYPPDAVMDIRYDTVMPPLFWLNAVNEADQMVDFELSDVYCNASEHPTIVFAVSAGWCPYCPDYMAMIDSITPQLEEEGALVVYMVIETASGAPATNMQAHTLIKSETMPNGHSIRVGDRDSAGGVALPFSGAVEALPSAFVVRTRDMRVIASQDRSSNYLDFLSIVRNPERLW